MYMTTSTPPNKRKLVIKALGPMSRARYLFAGKCTNNELGPFLRTSASLIYTDI